MNSNNSEQTGDNPKHLLDELQTLLEKQVAMARQGNLKDLEALSKQAGSLSEKIAQMGILDPAEPVFNEGRQEKLQKLYEKLCLAITDQKAVVSKELNRVRKGKKTIQTYRSHI
ncbi:MAG: hypothetical protein GWN67_12665 [Phycisphaerae bacterium]|nr:hypothetical protein [Phycisphaerae bacterium]NIP52898.1 hypothetical protein [Phycisphaerae bacterium]NIS51949.1 hypothetical protein [Phycisphaerae bacterium]NIU09463.1 hypothetical protein [Phycisphaerae bacterium]NIU57196.1 hypothetical protein [Phycisphaerae bacterium]